MDAGEIPRHRHDTRLAMWMLSRLDRMADSPPQGSDAALARVVAQDFAAYLDMLCPEDQAQADRPDAPPPPPPMAPDADHAPPPRPPPPPEAAANEDRRKQSPNIRH